MSVGAGTSLISSTNHRKGLEFNLKFLLRMVVASHLTKSSYVISFPGIAEANTITRCAFRDCLRGEQIPRAKSMSGLNLYCDA